MRAIDKDSFDKYRHLFSRLWQKNKVAAIFLGLAQLTGIGFLLTLWFAPKPSVPLTGKDLDPDTTFAFERMSFLRDMGILEKQKLSLKLALEYIPHESQEVADEMAAVTAACAPLIDAILNLNCEHENPIIENKQDLDATFESLVRWAEHWYIGHAFGRDGNLCPSYTQSSECNRFTGFLLYTCKPLLEKELATKPIDSNMFMQMMLDCMENVESRSQAADNSYFTTYFMMTLACYCKFGNFNQNILRIGNNTLPPEGQELVWQLEQIVRHGNSTTPSLGTVVNRCINLQSYKSLSRHEADITLDLANPVVLSTDNHVLSKSAPFLAAYNSNINIGHIAARKGDLDTVKQVYDSNLKLLQRHFN